jgi:hypothetical protein
MVAGLAPLPGLRNIALTKAADPSGQQCYKNWKKQGQLSQHPRPAMEMVQLAALITDIT